MKTVGHLSKPPNKQKVRVSLFCRIHSKSIYKKLKVEFMEHYFKQTDDQIFEFIRQIIQEGPTYGYNQFTAILNLLRLELKLER